MLLKRIKVGGVGELSIVILGIQLSLGLLGDLEEVVDVEGVREVLVEVVLEVLEEVHVLLDKVVSSNSREGEGLVVELPGVYAKLRVLSVLDELSIDLHGIVVVLSIKSSGEVVELDIELLLRDVEGLLTFSG